ncbi:YtxH domain-containing protein [Achromobacter insuavis]|uniref:YtxH domain-containing protein n=1 Tax=Achromobacter TaxID=222 RepID=UPI001F12B685|nr:YtxH domain-containing protein [Achromobacter insuavis]
MPEAWVPLISTLIGAAVGGTVAMLTARMTNRSNAAREKERYAAEQTKHRTDLIRSRAEELYVLFEKWEADLKVYQFSQFSWICGKISRAEALDVASKHMPTDRNTGRMEMLVQAYFPEVSPAYASFLASRDMVNSVMAACGQHAGTPEATARTRAAMEESHERGAAVRQAILRQLRSL